MNKVILIGRLTKDVETRDANDTTIARFSVAVNRPFKNADGEYEADFPNCVAFGKTAEFVSKYFSKGMAIGLTGRLQTGSYTNKNGVKVYTTEVVAETAEFVESKKSSEDTANTSAKVEKATQKQRPIEEEEEDDSDYPFN